MNMQKQDVRLVDDYARSVEFKLHESQIHQSRPSFLPFEADAHCVEFTINDRTPGPKESILPNETERLAALRRYGILDTMAEQSFDDLALLASQICETPIALITLVDEQRQWFKAKVGLSISETPRMQSICAHAIQQRGVFAVTDTTKDERFTTNPLVTSEVRIRFYAAAPLVTPGGHAIGTICVLDTVPRVLSPAQLQALQALSRQVMKQLELRLALRELEETAAERNQKTAELQRNERLLSTILETLPVSVCYLNSRGEFQLANPADETLWTGSKRPALDEMASYKIWRAGLQNRMSEEKWGITQAVSDGIATLEELREIVCWDGTHKSILHSAVPLKDSDGKIGGAIAVNQDITELKRMEKTLRESEEMFRQVVENINEVFWMTNVEKSQMLYISPGYEKIWGRSCKELCESPNLWIEAIHPEDRDRVVGKTHAHLQISGEFNEEYRIIRPDGSMRWIRDRAFPVKEEEGGVVRIVGIATDVTEQKQTEELLRKSEAEFRVTFENAAFGMALADPKGYFLKTNRSFQMLLGYTDAELQSMSFLEFTHPDDVEKDWNPYQELIEGKCEHYQIEKRYVRKNKEVLSVRLIVSAVRGAANELLYAIGMVEDITEKRKLENQFMRAQRLESIGTLAGGIAHDLNNVLAPIVMSCELLMKEVKDVAHSRLLTAIDSSAKRGVELVKQVVTFARGNEGRRILLQPEHLIEEVTNIAVHSFPKRVRIRKAVPEKLWNLWADSTQFHQVLLNLCVNARDAMPTGGDLTITAENILVDHDRAARNPELKPGPYVVINIRDTGMGIDQDNLDKVFDPFFTTKEVGKGTGLGLFTALGIVKGHGGCISLTSEVEEGANFEVWLPAVPPEKASPPQLQDVRALRGHGELVLVVDDEASVRALTKEMLEAYGYKVFTAAQGADAVAICAQHKEAIKVVITDMMMPVMDGIELIRNLLQINSSLGIIALSGASNEQCQSNAFKSGAKVFLSKPCQVETLLKSVYELFPHE